MASEHPTRRGWSWRRIALPASLILNLFLVAIIGGHMLRREYMERPAGNSLAAVLLAAEHRLPPSDAAAFDAAIRRDAASHIEALRQLAVARRALEKQITSDNFDKEATKQALAAWRMSINRFVEEYSNALVDALSQVSPESRRKLIEARRERMRGVP